MEPHGKYATMGSLTKRLIIHFFLACPDPHRHANGLWSSGPSKMMPQVLVGATTLAANQT